MEWMHELWHKLRMLLRRGQAERELEEEMCFHLAMKGGDDAARAFGNVTLLREESRQAWGWTWIERLIQDLRYALRVLRKTPSFTAIALATVALGVAANVTVFSFIDALFLRSLDVAQGDRLVRIYGTDGRRVSMNVNYDEYRYLRDHTTTLDALAAHYSTAPFYVSIGSESGELQGAVVSNNYFPMLGLKPALGRFFTAEEDSVPDRDAVAVIGYGLWQSRFGGDPAVTSRSLRINGKPFQIVGVAPEGFRGVLLGNTPNQLWIPLMMVHAGYRWCDALKPECPQYYLQGTLAPGKTIEQAQAELGGLMRQAAAARPWEDGYLPLVVEPAAGVRPGDQRGFRTLSRLLAATAGMLLAIACANLGGLLLARGTARAKEIAMRVSLGASRARVMRQLLTESVLLAAGGGALGVVLSLWTSRLLFNFYTTDSEGYQNFYDFSLAPRVLAFAAGVSVLTGILFGMFPAWQASRTDTADALKAQGGGTGHARPRLILTSAQIALSLALLVGAGLVGRSAVNLEDRAAFDLHHVAALRLRPRLVNYTPAKAQAFVHEVVGKLSNLSGVESVTLTRGQGFVWKAGGDIAIRLPGQQPPDPKHPPTISFQEIAPGFFKTLRIRMDAGREFDERDQPGSPRVAIVNATLARRMWGGSTALYQTLLLDDQPYRVVGLVADAIPRSGMEGPAAMAYIPYWQNNTVPQVDARMAVRVQGDPAAALPAIKRAIADIDADVPVTEMMPMIEQVRGSYTDVRVASAVLMSSSLLALLLAGLGLYGVISFTAGKRTREVGIRMALGARPRKVVALFLRQGLILLGSGAVCGLVLAMATTRLLGAWLYGVSSSDPLVFLVALAALIATTFLASWIPARRAALVDPMKALRVE